MYSVAMYGHMIADSARTDAYAEALRRLVKPDSVVLDIGAGTGIFSLLACRFGARRVYAVEPADAIQIAREIATANGYADRIECIQKLSTEITLPEQADVIVSDIRGVLPFLGNHISSIRDARERLLKPGGALIPQRDEVWVGVVEAGETYDEYCQPWDRYDFDMTAARRIVTNTVDWSIKPSTAEILLAEPQLWATLDYALINDPNASGELKFTVSRDGWGHGLLIWFDAILAEGVGFSNAPGAEKPAKVYGRRFFPWLHPVALKAGDQVNVRLEARLVSDEYVYSWETTIRSCTQPHQIRVHFNQSTFLSTVFSPLSLRKQCDSYVPELNHSGLIDHHILSQMIDQKPLIDIAKRLAERFPDKFIRWEAALTRVQELALKYSK